MSHLRRGSVLVAVALSAIATAAVPTLSQAATVTTVSAAPGDATGNYYQVTPSRLLDTRTGLGATKAAPLGDSGRVDVQVTGRGGVPTASSVSAVVLNLTGITPTRGTYLTAYPAGASRPTASTLNLSAGQIRANTVTVPVSADGKVSVFNFLGSIDVAADVVGYYSKDDSLGTGTQFQLAVPGRMFDTRADGFPLYAGENAGMAADFNDPANPSDINTRIRALAVNITALNATKGGYLQAYARNAQPPTTSTLNLVPGKVVSNMAVVATGYDTDAKAPAINVLNHSSGTVDVLVDVVGFYDVGSTTGLHYRPITPVRIIDTRTTLGGHKAPIGYKETAGFTAPASVADTSTFALVANTTAVQPTKGTFLTVWDGATTLPDVSNLNPAAGDVVANATVAPLNDANGFSVFNRNGDTNVVMDVSGSFQYYTTGTASSPAKGTAANGADGPTATRQAAAQPERHTFRAVSIR
jgi:hypothetical protein